MATQTKELPRQRPRGVTLFISGVSGLGWRGEEVKRGEGWRLWCLGTWDSLDSCFLIGPMLCQGLSFHHSAQEARLLLLKILFIVSF